MGDQLARWVYAGLLLLYPAAFRRRYREELILLFDDMYRAAAEQGLSAYMKVWLTVLSDLAASATRERLRTMRQIKWTTIISIVLCLPLLFVVTTTLFNYEPPFVAQLEQYLIAADGYSPTLLGRLVMLALLLSVPAAFVINLLPMRSKTSTDGISSFTVTPAHTIIGLSLLLVVMAIFSQQVLRELRPFVLPLGSVSFLGQGLCLVGLLPLPVAFLLNRLPQLTKSGVGRVILSQPTSATLIIGAALLLIILMLVSIFALEATACTIGVPNCD